MHASVETIYCAIYPAGLVRNFRAGAETRHEAGLNCPADSRWRQTLASNLWPRVSERPHRVIGRSRATGRAISSAAATKRQMWHARRAHHQSSCIRCTPPDGHDVEHVQQAIIGDAAPAQTPRNSLTRDQRANCPAHLNGASLTWPATHVHSSKKVMAPTRTPTGPASTSQRH